MRVPMDEQLKEKVHFLGLIFLEYHYDSKIAAATKEKMSYSRFLQDIITCEYNDKVERQRQNRLKNAHIPEMLVMETYPFSRQKRLKKRMVMELYDSMTYITESQTLLFFGPTGCGKTGLATAFLINAINNGYRGLFIDFSELIRQLFRAVPVHKENALIKKLASIDCLLIDELGYGTVTKEQSGLFFELIKARHRKKCTIITSQHGFDEWNSFLNNPHITAALIDRITEKCTLFNMTKCESIRKKDIKEAIE